MTKEDFDLNMYEWDKRLQGVMVDFFNYYTARGPLEELTDEDSIIRKIAETMPMNKKVIRYRQELGGFFTTHEQLLKIPGINLDRLKELAPLINQLKLLKLKVLAPQTTWQNQVEAYVNGPDNLYVILEEIKHAKSYIHLSMMLFFNDRAGKRITQALLDALARGVIVRVMVDYGITGFGYKGKFDLGDFQSLAEKLKAAGGKVIDCFHTCYSNMDWTKKRAELREKGVIEEILVLQDWVQKGILNDLNVVNHRKFFVIDGITSILGSLNIGDQYIYETPIVSSGPEQVDGRALGVPREVEQWHDGCFRIHGALALSLNRLYQAHWIVLGGDLFDPEDLFYFPDVDRNYGMEECTLVTSFPGNPVNLIKQYLLDLITYAADETLIVNPYMIDEDFWITLQSLGEETLQHISICNPLLVNDHLTNQAAIRCNMYEPFLKGVKFFDYSKTGRFSHWKINYDRHANCVFHGSYNLNTRSAIHDFEVGVLVKSKPFADKIKAMIDYDLSVSEEITEVEEFYKYPRLHPSNYLNDVFKYFS